MMTDLKESITRLNDHDFGVSVPDYRGKSTVTISAQHYADLKLCYKKIHELEFRLARYDDPRLIDEAGLRELGLKQTQRMEYEHSGMRWWGLGLRVWKCFDGLWTVTLLTDDDRGGLPQETHLPNHKTIGQLAHLLDALGTGGGGGC